MYNRERVISHSVGINYNFESDERWVASTSRICVSITHKEIIYHVVSIHNQRYPVSCYAGNCTSPRVTTIPTSISYRTCHWHYQPQSSGRGISHHSGLACTIPIPTANLLSGNLSVQPVHLRLSRYDNHLQTHHCRLVITITGQGTSQSDTNRR